MADGFVIPNKHTPTKTSVSVEKVWDDDNNRDNIRGNYTVSLLANGTEVSNVTLAKGKTTYTWRICSTALR